MFTVNPLKKHRESNCSGFSNLMESSSEQTLSAKVNSHFTYSSYSPQFSHFIPMQHEHTVTSPPVHISTQQKKMPSTGQRKTQEETTTRPKGPISKTQGLTKTEGLWYTVKYSPPKNGRSRENDSAKSISRNKAGLKF